MHTFDNPQAFKALLKKAQEWGGDIIELSRKDLERVEKGGTTYKGHRIYPCPFNDYLWVVWHTKVLLYEDPGDSFPRRFSGVRETIRWGDLLHEMAHVFASKVQPNRSVEQDFLGWEYQMAKDVVGNLPEWYKCMSDYSTISGDDFGTLSPEDRETTLQIAVAHGKTYGNLTSSGEPINIR